MEETVRCCPNCDTEQCVPKQAKHFICSGCGARCYIVDYVVTASLVCDKPMASCKIEGIGLDKSSE